MSYLDLGFNENLSIANVGQQNQQLNPLAFEQFTQEISGSKIQGGQFSSVDKNLILDLENNLFSVSKGGLSGLSIGQLKDGTFGLQAKDINENITFYIDGTSGNATFLGTVAAGSLVSDAEIEGGSININDRFLVDSKGNTELGSLSFNKQLILTSFESFDGWAVSAGATAALGGAALQTGATSGTQRQANDEILGTDELDFDNKNPVFESQVAVSSLTNQTIYFGAGNLNIGDGTQEGFGFKIVNGTLTALSIVSNGITATETNTTITGITLTSTNRYQAVMDSNNSIIKFYVNGALKATHTSSDNIPNGTSPTLMSFSIINSANENKILYLRRAMFFQD